ncbi:MAG: peptide deformylase [Deltaproteobacteria bacterium RBG_13_61_14]|nr:MAG: peptide deformylase [Deltaproteobacteria bacterium RBG_13_61_14]
MSLLEIVTFPHPALKTKADEVKSVNPDLERLARDLAETMYHAPGIGLAANQVGVLQQVAVVDVSGPEEAKNLVVLVNPRIVEAEEREALEEGCLSVPGYRAEVERAARITVRAKNLKGADIEIHAEGLFARALQHEIDHLQGKLFLDRIGRLKRSQIIREIKKKKMS